MASNRDEYSEEHIKIYCGLRNPADPNKICLTENYLVYIKNRGKVYFPLKEITGLNFTQKVLILPTVLGGIVAPLFLVAGFNGTGNIWLMLSLAFSGLLLLYFGLSGTDTISIERRHDKNYDIFLLNANPSLIEFTSFIGELINKNISISKMFSIALTKEQHSILNRGGTVPAPEDGFCLGINVNKPLNKLEYLLDDPVGKGCEIKFKNISGKKVPVLFDNLTPKMIVFENDENPDE